jgi:glycerol uptake facilitator-like aquaporin
VKRAVFAEFLGALLLSATVIGSGVMAERLSGGNTAVALLGNTLATVAVLAVLIAMLGPVSGAHFNPAVTLALALRDRTLGGKAVWYVVFQMAGCCAGAILANVMFDLSPVNLAAKVRTGSGQWIGEFVATAGLVLVAFTSPSIREAAWRVPAWIAAAYWFTSSTSFANPAISVGRALSDSFAGIRMGDVPAFILAQLLGAAAGLAMFRVFRPGEREEVT